jgi:hypothetical protein
MNVSDSIRPRPVWARYLRRINRKQVGPITDAERRDAILILHDAHIQSWAPGGHELHTEALRILDEDG